MTKKSALMLSLYFALLTSSEVNADTRDMYIRSCKAEQLKVKQQGEQPLDVDIGSESRTQPTENIRVTFHEGNLKQQIDAFIKEYFPKFNLVVWHLSEDLAWPNQYTFVKPSASDILTEILEAYSAVGLRYTNDVIVFQSNDKLYEDVLVDRNEYYTGETTTKPAEIHDLAEYSQVSPLVFNLKSGLLKPQLDELVRQFIPDKSVYWGSYEGKHEWYGDAEITGSSVEELLNEITSSYGKPPRGIQWLIHNNVVEFIYKNPKG